MSSPSIFGFDFIGSKPASHSDTADIVDGQVVGLHVRGTAGEVKVTYSSPDGAGSAVTDTLYLAQGSYLKAPIKRVWSTGTTATNIHVLYGKWRSFVAPV